MLTFCLTQQQPWATCLPGVHSALQESTYSHGIFLILQNQHFEMKYCSAGFFLVISNGISSNLTDLPQETKATCLQVICLSTGSVALCCSQIFLRSMSTFYIAFYFDVGPEFFMLHSIFWGLPTVCLWDLSTSLVWILLSPLKRVLPCNRQDL